jgi:hypothetical protein
VNLEMCLILKQKRLRTKINYTNSDIHAVEVDKFLLEHLTIRRIFNHVIKY